MNDEIKKRLEKEIVSQLKYMENFNASDDEKKGAVSDFVKIYKEFIDGLSKDSELCYKRDKDVIEQKEKDVETKLKERELELKQQQIKEQITARETEMKFKKQELEFKCKQLEEQITAREEDEKIRIKQLSEQEKDRYLRIGLDVANIILPLLFYATWMQKGFRFEETGTFTSTTFRGLFNRFRPTK